MRFQGGYVHADDITQAVKAGHDDDQRSMTLIRHACLAHKGIGAHKAGYQRPQNQHSGRIASRDKEVLEEFDPLTGIPADRQIAGQTNNDTRLKAIHGSAVPRVREISSS